METNKNTRVADEKTGDMIQITHDKLDLQALTETVALPQCGAISTFLGKI